MSEYIVEMYDECEKYVLEYGCKPTYTQGFPLREEVVRCRDCKYRHEGMCMLTDGMGDFKRWFVDDDDYCSDGEKVVGA